MTDRPIIFLGPMVRALIEGRKTQTRRVLKIQPKDRIAARDPQGKTWHWKKGLEWFGKITLPYAIGDRLWVRETFRQAYPKTSFSGGFIYRADKPRALGMGEYSDHQKWKPSIHMPRRLSRLTLTVTDVKVERLQDISEADAIAEGITLAPHPRPAYRVELKTPNHLAADAVDADKARSCFMRLWQSIHGPDAWNANPWVVALTFTADQRNIDA